ncbi:hypothetical protein PRIPAC_76955 [Pristionchus pacificus]|uniref:G protein-coupled receptor n=1 Tax=Pristionchus pacificus TaxID=54126 RepID=A0A2A6C3Z9_PRIPA|nr:hypothetical protein PRIPAC_76955 [Pristionchus pacificus]|eukprot:PDM72773.1 G protein-coupled receptor [Pristionchus pacificus]
MDSENAYKIKAYRYVGYAAVSFSSLAVLSLAVTLPLVANYARELKRTSMHELAACKSFTNDVYTDVLSMKSLPSHNRTARQSVYDLPVDNAPQVHEEPSCNGCCTPGPAGPQGAPGRPGHPGAHGAPGSAGNPGRPPATPCEPLTPPPCPQCPAGAPGLPGTPGEAGNDGTPGAPGSKGPDGENGEDGNKGRDGRPGAPGKRGENGAPGKNADKGEPIPGPNGQPGAPGPQGRVGPAGPPGKNGAPGHDGEKGQPGNNGAPGNDGEQGEPGFPGQEGTEGEKGICPKYCALDGGIFFEDGSRHIYIRIYNEFNLDNNDSEMCEVAHLVCNKFGILCAYLATNNSILLVRNSVWYFMPNSGIFKAGTIVSRIVGMIGLTLWFVGIRLHLLISVNHFIAIVFPFKNLNRNCCILIISPMLTARYWFVLYIINLSNTIELASVLIFDVVTLIHLKLNHSKTVSAMNAISSTTRTVEIQLFKQAFSQSIPLLVTLIFFAFVTTRLSDDFVKFLTTTFVCHLALGVGLIIDIFHTRFDFFRAKKNNDRSIGVSSSFAPTTASLFGFTTNLIAFLTINFNPKLHTSYLMPETEIFEAGAPISRFVGMMALSIWMLGNRLHLLISINRLIAIIFPIDSHKYITIRGIILLATLATLSALLQASPTIFVDGVWFCYYRNTMRWSFPSTEKGKFYEAYICNLPVVIELTSILVVDTITIIHLSRVHKEISLKLSNANAAETNAAEIRLFKQSFSQSIPLLVGFIGFAFITPLFADDFSKFLTTTFAWHIQHGVDGLIIDIFHTLLDLFKRKKITHEKTNSIAPSVTTGHEFSMPSNKSMKNTWWPRRAP